MTLQKSAHALRRRIRLGLARRLDRARFTEAIVLGFHVGAWAPVTGALVLKRRRVPRLAHEAQSEQINPPFGWPAKQGEGSYEKGTDAYRLGVNKPPVH